MPFGLNIAPLIFTRMMRAALKPLKEKGIRIVAYLDDILIISESDESSYREYEEDSQLVGETGIYGELQEIHFMPDTEDGVPGDNDRYMRDEPECSTRKISRVIQREARQILTKDTWSARKLAATIGIMNSMCKAMSPGMLMTRYLLANLTEALKSNGINWNTTQVKALGYLEGGTPMVGGRDDKVQWSTLSDNRRQR